MPAIHLKALLAVTFLVVINIAVAPASRAETDGDNVFTKAEDEALESKIKSYLNDNPEIIVNAVKDYRTQKRRAQRQQASENVEKYLDAITDPANNPDIGADNPTVTVVEFMDYNCGYCKRALEGVRKVLKNRNDVRFVFQDVAVLGPSSDNAARWALAAEKQGRYFDYHVALMQHKSKKSHDVLRSIANEAGLDANKLEQDARTKEIKQAVKHNQEIMQDIGIRGTPGFIINGEVHRGFMPYEDFKQRITEAAQKNRDN